jgi:ADP-heptose:LPS heptosyltransferase
MGNGHLAKLCLVRLALGRSNFFHMALKRYLGVLRNLAYLVTVGMWRSVQQLRKEFRKAADLGLNLHVVIMTGGMGDMIAAEPSVRKIIRADEHVVMLARSTYLSLLDFDPSIDAAIRVDAYLQTLLLKKLFRAARWTNLHLDGYRCNMFRIAVANANAAGITVANYYDNRTLAEAYWLANVGSSGSDNPRVYPDPSFDVHGFLKNSFLTADRPLLVLHTQATESIRSWPAALCRKTMARLQADTEINILELGLNPVLESSVRVFQLRNRVPLSQQMAIMRRAVAFLGVDSGFAHIATAIGLPCALLLCAYKDFKVYLPWSVRPDDIVIRSSLTMQDIAYEQVLNAAMQVTARRSSRFQA